MTVQTIPLDLNMDVGNTGTVQIHLEYADFAVPLGRAGRSTILHTYVPTAALDDLGTLDFDTDILHGNEARGLAAASRRALRRRMSEDDSVPR